MSKIVLADLANLQNETTAVNAINRNNTTLEAASDNTLSRDGQQPNHMLSTLDMNSNPIINLPAAGSDGEPVRRAEYQLDIAALSHNTALLPNSVSNTILADMPAATYKGRTTGSGDPQDIPVSNLTHVFNVKDYGAVGDGGTDDTVAIKAATLACINAGGGTVYFPAGTYICPSNAIALVNRTGISFLGASSCNCVGGYASILLFTGTSGSLITLDGTEGITFQNLSFQYNNAAYIGILIDLAQNIGGVNTSFTTFREFSFTSSGRVLHTATGFISLNRSLNTYFERGFISGAVAGIIGADHAGADQFCNGVYIDGIWFDTPLDQCILAGGVNWNITNCIFEPNQGSGACIGIYVNLIGVDGFALINNSFEDALTGIWVSAIVGGIRGGIISGNLFQGGGYAASLDAASSGLSITGNSFINGALAGTGLIKAANLCTDVIAIGNSFSPAINLFDGGNFPTGKSIIDNNDGLGIRVQGGKVIMSGLPTSAPATTGALWNSSGTVKIV